jgi:hypothetical protein
VTATVWERRDLPVLRALATSDDEHLRHGLLSLDPGENALGLELSAGEVHDAIFCLGDVGYVEGEPQYSTGPSVAFTHLRVTGRGQQALGEWPLFDGIASPATLALFLERLADESATDEEADNLRRAAGYARGLSAASLRAVAIGVLSQLAKAGLGLG